MIKILRFLFCLFSVLNCAEQFSAQSTLYRQWAPVTVGCTCASYPHNERCPALPAWHRLLSCMVKVTGPEYEIRGVCEGRGSLGNVFAQHVASLSLNQRFKLKLEGEIDHATIYDEVYTTCLEARNTIIRDIFHISTMNGCALALMCYRKDTCIGKAFHIGSSKILHIKDDGQILFSSALNDHLATNRAEIERLKNITKEDAFFERIAHGASLLQNVHVQDTRLFGMIHAYGAQHREICVPCSYDIKIAPGSTVIIGTRALMEKIAIYAPLFFKREISHIDQKYEFPVSNFLKFLYAKDHPKVKELGDFNESDEGSLHIITRN
jgi:hypothetical protein